jgi:hypothetical protein
MDETDTLHNDRSERINVIAQKLHSLQDAAEHNRFSQKELDNLLSEFEHTIQFLERNSR